LVDNRLKLRSVDEVKFGETVSDLAHRTEKWQTAVTHGGTTVQANYYTRVRDITMTEIALAVSDPMGLTVVWLSTCDSVYITDRRIAYVCLKSNLSLLGEGVLDIYDNRVTRKDRLDKAWEILRAEHARRFSPMEKLAAMSL